MSGCEEKNSLKRSNPLDISKFKELKKDLLECLYEIDDRKLLQVAKIAKTLNETLINEKKIIWCGNGGSASQSDHLAAEFVGRFRLSDRKPLNSISLTSNNSTLTAIGNDYGFEDIFSRQLLAYGEMKDSLVVLSTSGKSSNIIRAMKTGKELGINVFAIFGENDNNLDKYCDECININSSSTARIQEMQLFIGHLICEYIDVRTNTFKT
tara:strand:+ start:43 stop:672 length:630 start_codon:yes stop_codon:yes gene_type:complete